MGRALQRSQTKKFKVKSNGSSRHGAGMQSSGAASIGISNNEQTQISSDNGMKSVLEVDDLTDFLARAELANREFTSEREQFIVVDNVAQQVVLGAGGNTNKRVQWDTTLDEDDSDDGIRDNYRQQQQRQYQNDNSSSNKSAFEFRELSVPRRPKWDHTTTPEQLDQNEKDAFLQWRRAIAMKEEQILASQSQMSTSSSSNQNVSVTPFEKNLQVWRQLWRVLERSECIVLVVDGRNPLFYISLDLRSYVEDELQKSLIVVVNKCDYLTATQRAMWHEYFCTSMNGLEHVFFSAVEEQQILDNGAKLGGGDIVGTENVNDDDDSSHDDNDANVEAAREEQKEKEIHNQDHHVTLLNPKSIGIEKPLARKELLDILCEYVEIVQKGKNHADDESSSNDNNRNNSHGTNQNKKDENGSQNNAVPIRERRIEFGMVGFPNVGKSSVLNVLVGASKNNHKTSRVGVASQPGKTKHFQTLNVPDYKNITLCDCPGLVFPSFVSSNADLVLAGVYPLSQVRDYWPAVELICRRIPREILEVHFGIVLPRPSTLDVAQRGGDATLSPPTAEELLKSYCICRSLLAASSGVPDYYTASRIVLRDYVNGSILYCHSPPKPKRKAIQQPALDDNKWEDDFYKQTILTALLKEEKLRHRLGVNTSTILRSSEVQGDNEITEMKDDRTDQNTAKTTDADDHTDGVDFDLDIFDMIGGNEGGSSNASQGNVNGGKRGKKHKSMQKWGKKGRKNRNKDPYGCHTEPDDELLGERGGEGLIVNAGKYGKKNYTRPTYRGAKSAVN
mmetsp:Transcript_6170/g.9347  ORF Transcript_6170/g.9347 Transcript_6170/m.9347 type:complete len:790 (-) Transcript_6170:30-2399(-)